MKPARRPAVKDPNLVNRRSELPWFERPAVRHALALCVLVFCALLVYANSFHVPLLLDNDEIILKDPRVQSTSSFQLHRIFAGQYWETALTGLYRPFTTLTYLFNYTILGNGPNPEGYHWFNFLAHASNMVLVYALGVAIFAEIPAAMLVALLWGLHPVNTEAVTNVVGRADLLSTMGVLAALLCHRRAVSTDGSRRALWLVGVFLAAAVGVFSKEAGIVLIAVLLVHDLTVGPGGSWKHRAISYGSALIPAAAYLWIRAGVVSSGPAISTSFGDNPLLGTGFWTARATALKVIYRYVALLVWPANLSYDYSFNQVPLVGWRFTGQDLQAVAGLLLCVGALAAAVVLWRRRPAISFGVLFFFVAFAPVSNIFLLIGTIMGERLLYLPSIGCVVLAVAGLSALRTRVPSTVWQGAIAVLLLACAARSWSRNGEWLDQQRFWWSAAEASPDSYKTNINAATSTFAFVTPEDWYRALRQTDRALAILDALPDALNAPNAYRQAGVFYRTLGDQVAAKPAVPGGVPPEAWYQKSLDALVRSERIEVVWDRRYRVENAQRGIPGLTALPAKVYLELGRTYTRLKDFRHAVEAFERGRRLESAPDLLEELAAAYRAVGDPRNAALALVEAMAVDSARTRLAPQLLDAYKQADPAGCALAHDATGDSLNLACPMVHNDICAASRNVAVSYDRHGQALEAGEIRRLAMQDLGCTAAELK